MYGCKNSIWSFDESLWWNVDTLFFLIWGHWCHSNLQRIKLLHLHITYLFPHYFSFTFSAAISQKKSLSWTRKKGDFPMNQHILSCIHRKWASQVVISKALAAMSCSKRKCHLKSSRVMTGISGKKNPPFYFSFSNITTTISRQRLKCIYNYLSSHSWSFYYHCH